jgi:hypothetical protein
MRPVQRHRHVEIVSIGGECPVEDRHRETRVDRVDHVGDGVLPAEISHRVGSRCVHLNRAKASIRRRDRPLRAAEVVVAHDHRVEEIMPVRNPDRGRADASRAAH